MNQRKMMIMMLNKNILCEIAICIFVLIFAGTAAAREIDEYTLFSSMSVKEIADAENNSLIRENIQILLNFTLGSGNNGIVPSGEDVIIEFRIADIAEDKNQRFKIFIPACSFVKEKLWYEIYEPNKPSEIGIKVLSFDDSTIEVFEDLTDTLLFFEAILTSKDEKSHYLFIEAIFKHENTKELLPLSINSSTKSLLIVGDDVGTTF
jgi:hypothetical protein